MTKSIADFISWFNNLFTKKENKMPEDVATTSTAADASTSTAADTATVSTAVPATVSVTVEPAVADSASVAPVSDSTDTPADSAVVADDSETAAPKSGVNDLDAALAFIEDGIGHLGEIARDELIALAKKYL